MPINLMQFKAHNKDSHKVTVVFHISKCKLINVDRYQSARIAHPVMTDASSHRK